jgi:hypothetical protein
MLRKNALRALRQTRRKQKNLGMTMKKICDGERNEEEENHTLKIAQRGDFDNMTG